MVIRNLFNYKVNLPFKDELIKEAVDQRQYGDKGFNFILKTKYRADLYNIFIQKCKELFKNITIIEDEFNVWCSVSDKDYTLTNWHSHENTANVNAVFYLKLTSQEKGIDFFQDGRIYNYIPKENELIIFPSTLSHHPNVSKGEEKRISMNLELLTKEDTKSLFEKENINEI